jgi:hypothetical protein
LQLRKSLKIFPEVHPLESTYKKSIGAEKDLINADAKEQTELLRPLHTGRFKNALFCLPDFVGNNISKITPLLKIYLSRNY